MSKGNYIPWTFEQVQDAIYYIPSEDRKDWYRVLTALKTEFGEAAYSLAEEWSQATTAENYKSQDLRDVWRGLESGTFNIGGLKTLAEQHGYTQSKEYKQEAREERAARTARILEQQKQEAIHREVEKKAAKQEVNSRWQNAVPANPRHQYLQNKGLLPNGVRQEGNLLLIPRYFNNELVNLQFINPKGDKWSINGGQSKDAYSLIGDANKLSEGFYITEGWATGATVHEQTGKPVICAMNEGNLLGVAKTARLNFPTAKIVIAADNDHQKAAKGKINTGLDSAYKAAKPVGAAVVAPPFQKGDSGTDWNDYHLLNLLTGKSSQTKTDLECVSPTATPPTHFDIPKPKPHPLSQFITLGSAPKPPKWVIKSFIAEGVVIIAGGHGAGKTTALFPLAMAAAGIHRADYPLAPHEWRHVIYITEDVNQAQRIAAGYLPSINKSMDDLNERVHVVDAKRMDAAQMVEIGNFYRESFTRTVKGSLGEIELLPLVVVDTLAATFDIENENDNAEASRTIAHIKQDFSGLPVWIISHVSKGSLTRENLKGANPTSRGASAFEADANQVLYITLEEDESRWLARGKTRFESPYKELKVMTDYKKVSALNEYGEPEELTLRWGVPEPQEKGRAEIVEEAKEKQAEAHHDRLKRTLLDEVTAAWVEAAPLNKTGAKAKIRGKYEIKTQLVEELLSSGWLYEVFVPKDIQLKNKPSFLVALEDGERKEFLATGKPPKHKLEIPLSWSKENS